MSNIGLLPAWVIWAPRPFPDTNLLLLAGRTPALIDSGFVGHADRTATWVQAHTDRLALVVNTHWHADHVGGNASLQAAGVSVAAGALDAAALERPDPGCCQAEYLDQPVAPYTVDDPLIDGQTLRLGAARWQVIGTPGHTPGHLSLWQPDDRLLIVGDALSDYDVGWVNIALDGPNAAAVALASLQRLAELSPRVLLPAHGPIPRDPRAAFTAGLRRARRLVEDPDGAIRYGARRILAFALMIRNGIPVRDIGPYLQARAWFNDAAGLLSTAPEDLASELINSMLGSGAICIGDDRLHATADHTPVSAEMLRVPFPASWPRGCRAVGGRPTTPE